MLEELHDVGITNLLTSPLQKVPPGTPAPWVPALTSKDSKLAVVNQLWSPWKNLLPLTLEGLSSKLQSVIVLMRNDHPGAWGYLFEMEKEPFLFVGNAPTKPTHPSAARLPSNFLSFYDLHDGWTDPYKTTGPLPGNEWPLLSFLIDIDSGLTESKIKPKNFLIIAQFEGDLTLPGFDDEDECQEWFGRFDEQ